jgi:tRNA uridine 5-carboxymethylaminomethyl modification enzyme
MKRFPAGRLGDAPSVALSASLNAAGFKLGRLQTGTPARLDRNTIDFSNLSKQEGDPSPSPFSYLNDIVDNAVRFLVVCLNQYQLRRQDNQVPCFQTETTPTTHQIVKDNLHLSVHIQETRKGLGFRYYVCIVFP